MQVTLNLIEKEGDAGLCVLAASARRLLVTEPSPHEKVRQSDDSFDARGRMNDGNGRPVGHSQGGDAPDVTGTNCSGLVQRQLVAVRGKQFQHFAENLKIFIINFAVLPIS